MSHVSVPCAVQLWIVGNYHWYLKQSLDFGREPRKAPICVCWDPVGPLRLHVVTRGWSSITYDWGWTTERSPGLDAADNAGVAVIDGGRRQRRGNVQGSESRFSDATFLFSQPRRQSPGHHLQTGRGPSSHVFL